LFIFFLIVDQLLDVQLFLLTVVTTLHRKNLIESCIINLCFAQLISYALVKANFILKFSVFIASLFNQVKFIIHLPLTIMVLEQQVAIANNFASLFNILLPSRLAKRLLLILGIRMIQINILGP